MWTIIGIPVAAVLLVAVLARLLGHEAPQDFGCDDEWWWRIK